MDQTRENENLLDRRAFMATAAAAMAAPLAARATTGPDWHYDFDIHALGGRVGHHRVRFERQGGLLHVHIDIDLKVRVFLIGTFGYWQKVHEIWDGDQLTYLRAETDDDKRHDIVEARLGDDGQLATTSTRLGLKHWPGTLWPASSVWKHSSVDHTGGFLDLTRGNIRPTEISLLGRETFHVLGQDRAAQRYRVKSRRELEVLYGTNGDWLGLEWSQFGFTANYIRRA